MTPETRAARDSLSVQLERADRFPQFDALIVGNADLRLVLAALDQQPDGLVTFAHELTEAEFEAFKQWWRTRHIAARHDGTLRVLDEDRPAGTPDAAQLDYRAARREQHPTDSEDGWKPGDIR